MPAEPDPSVVGREARVEGRLVSSGSLEIHGQMKGDISVEGEVLVTAQAVVEAEIRAGGINVGGRIKGNLTAPGDVTLPPESWVEGEVKARCVTVHGTVTGIVVAEDKIELGPDAYVDGDLACRSLVVAEGAYFSGRCAMEERQAEAVPTA